MGRQSTGSRIEPQTWNAACALRSLLQTVLYTVGPDALLRSLLAGLSTWSGSDDYTPPRWLERCNIYQSVNVTRQGIEHWHQSFLHLDRPSTLTGWAVHV
jgi:hypothetical protein